MRIRKTKDGGREAENSRTGDPGRMSDPPCIMGCVMPRRTALVPAERIERAILLIRGRRVMLDSDLATLYGATTARLNEQVRRNPARFPADFAFQLARKECTWIAGCNGDVSRRR